GVRKGIYVLFILAIIPHLFVLKSDYETLNTAAVLEGLGWARFEMVIDFIAFLLIVSFVALCILQQRRLNHSLDNLTLPDSSNPTPGNDVLDKPRDEKESPEQRVTAKSK